MKDRMREIEGAFKDWLSGRAYWQQSGRYLSHGYYKLKTTDYERALKAPWSDLIKGMYHDTKAFHRAAHMWKERTSK